MARSRSITARLGDVFEDIQQPAYILDDQRRIAYCNDACEKWTGKSADQLVGKRCDYHAPISNQDESSLVAGLCPPPAALSGNYSHCVVAFPRENGPLSRRSALVVPLAGADASSSTLLVLVDGQDLAGESPADTVHSEAAQLHDRLCKLRSELGACYRPDQLLGVSTFARRIRDQVRLAIAARPRVAIIGPPGSGREHVARTIHYASQPESPLPLLALTCPVVDRETLQTTLRAVARRGPDAEPNRPSTLLLLEADSLSEEAQIELAGFLNLPGFDLRVICTVRKNLLDLAQQHGFRPDLAFALSTLVIELPALSQRPRDIPILAQHFLEEFNRTGAKQLSGFVPEALDLLACHSWPRNIDELATIVEEACRRAEGTWVTPVDLPKRIHIASQVTARSLRREENIQLDDFLLEIERELIRRALHRTKGNKAKSARILGIHRTRLLRRIAQLGLSDELGITAVQFEPLDPPEE